MSLPVFITTHRRPECCLALLKQLKEQSDEHKANFRVFVLRDKDDSDYAEVQEFCDGQGWTFSSTRDHFGRANYAGLLQRFATYMRFSDAEFFLFLQDDVALTAGFYAELKRLMASVCDPSFGVINLHVDKARRDGWPHQPWTEVKPEFGRFADKLGWFDLAAFFGSREALRCVNYTIPVVPSFSSSGVPCAWSQALAAAELTMFRVKRSLVKCKQVPSVMHPQTNVFMRLTSETVADD